MQDNGFITQWRAVGLVAIGACATLGGCATGTRPPSAQDTSAPHQPEGNNIATIAALPIDTGGGTLDAEPLEFTSAPSNAATQIGRASYYSNKFQGRRTASGEHYDAHAFTAAHRTLPLGSYVRVSNLSKTKSVVVRINDRGPFVKGRVLDLSLAAASELGLQQAGSAPVLIEPIEQRFAQATTAKAPERIMLRISHHPRRTHHKTHARH